MAFYQCYLLFSAQCLTSRVAQEKDNVPTNVTVEVVKSGFVFCQCERKEAKNPK